MQLSGRIFLWLAGGAFGLAILSFFVRVISRNVGFLTEAYAAPFFLTAFGMATLAFVLAVLVKLGVLSLAVPGETEADS